MKQLNITKTEIVEKTIQLYKKSSFYKDEIQLYTLKNQNQTLENSDINANIKIFFRRNDVSFKFFYVENNSHPSLRFITCIIGKNNIFKMNNDLISEKGSYTTLEDINSAVQNCRENQYILPLLMLDETNKLHPFTDSKDNINLVGEEKIEQKDCYKLVQEIHKEVTTEEIKELIEFKESVSTKMGVKIPTPNLEAKKYVEIITYWIDKNDFYIKKIENESTYFNSRNILIFNPIFDQNLDNSLFDN
ncbi:MAG: hypothetical protein EAZ85_00920 [Bacteroidetes bacterium]|nr:MAG: hypothetical protein EAZ85_00920 [Bacteroidota bacterium]TAG88115.1 MAG: hypothetical protein EAZ20_09190 [Bacteroidota bacterium]